MTKEQAKIAVAKGRDQGRVWKLDPEEYYSIGRGKDSKIHLSDPTVSTRHALLECVDGMWFVRDLGSKHGTWIDGEEVEERRAIFHKDIIRVGKTYLVMGIMESDEEAASWSADVKNLNLG